MEENWDSSSLLWHFYYSCLLVVDWLAPKDFGAKCFGYNSGFASDCFTFMQALIAGDNCLTLF
jgi:hypothetical protein